MPPSKAKASTYTPPTKGILSYLPSSWVPYSELIRLDKPHGIYMTIYPYILGLFYAGQITPAPIHLNFLLSRFLNLAIWTFLIRSAGCAWNDNVDQDFDRQTARCRDRPIARGAISTLQGHVFTTALVALGFLSIQDFPLESKIDGAATVLLTCIYPFGKRFTHFAQVTLGSTLSVSIVFGPHAVGANPLSSENFLPTACLVSSIIMLVIFYDVVYARQDTADDLKSGVKGMAVLFRNWITTLLLSLITAITTLLYITGKSLGLSPLFFGLSVAGPAISLLTMIVLIASKSSSSRYAGKFYVLAIFSLLSGFAVEYSKTIM
ncbi:hypothetical protein BBK36DRAFT_1108656 [Trichoderma citrinoviride]|uniref:UbiA prenyltransferase n=1 Tax=Trichoderma citrinoviride TaxID=58853 RepID=A0A2T4BLD2_9HYPO|nr:hypothetical protein BBK36DRAFT_1108656 [Trichoderma citrinoviride]PTB70123.1 hypothetical protein BBK36DRAFT_1108656 [Trichoderma citrinoviride]